MVNGKRIRVGRKSNERVLARGIRNGLPGDICGLAANFQRGARYRGLRAVFDQACYGSKLKLAPTNVAREQRAENN